ncbi:hypothetical protein GCM10028799_69000 [Kribbella italica]
MCDVPLQITRATPASKSTVTPTGVECTDPSFRTVLNTHKCRSVQNSTNADDWSLNGPDTP